MQRAATFSLCVSVLCLAPIWAGQTAKPTSAFEGQAIVHSLNGQVVAPDTATVWVLFGSNVLYEGMPDRQQYIDSAALYFENQSSGEWAKLKKAGKSVDQERNSQPKSPADQSSSEDVNQLHGLTLQIDDQALAATLEWSEKNRSKSWQLKRHPTEADGKWFVGDLTPGWYSIVVRAQFGKFDAAWQASVMVKPGQTFTMPQAPSVVFKRSN